MRLIIDSLVNEEEEDDVNVSARTDEDADVAWTICDGLREVTRLIADPSWPRS